MALANSKINYDYCTGDVVKTSLEQFEMAERRLAAKKQLINDLQNEYELLENQTLNIYKKNVNYIIIGNKEIILSVRDWLNMVSKNQDKDGNKLDKRKSYKEKDLFNYYTIALRNIFGAEIEITSVIDFNFGQAYEIGFNFNNHNWRLEIPMVSNINIKAFRDYGANCFRLKITHKDSDHFYTWVGATFHESELKDILQVGIEKYCKEEES